MSQTRIPESIRDYIYLDTDRARSIYSQLKGGLMESFMQGNATTEGSAKDINNREQSVEQNVLLDTKYEATHVLHDFLFSAIEADLEEAICDVQSVECADDLDPSDYFRVSGIAQIDDTQRFLRVLKDLNNLHSYVSMADKLEEMQKHIWDIQNRIDYEVLNKRVQEKLEKEILSLKPPALFRKTHQGVADLSSDMISLWLDLLYPGIFEIKILPDFSDRLVFRSIVDKEYLRENPAFTYAKHSSRTQASWTLVGQVTAIHSPKVLGDEDDDVDGEPSEDSPSNIRDSMDHVFDTFKPMEDHILVSASRTTVVSTPLAIYQETSTKKL